jgi:hypothetical protein
MTIDSKAYHVPPGKKLKPERMAHGRTGTDQIEEALSEAA